MLLLDSSNGEGCTVLGGTLSSLFEHLKNDKQESLINKYTSWPMLALETNALDFLLFDRRRAVL